MSLDFAAVCDLFETFDIPPSVPAHPDPRYPLVPARPSVVVAPDAKEVVINWVTEYRAQLDDPAATNLVAVLSTLLPDKRVDRIYALGERDIKAAFVKAQALGPSGKNDLDQDVKRLGLAKGIAQQLVMRV